MLPHIKAIAGNIIPAVSTTNAIVAALACLNGIRILTNEESSTYQNVTASYLTYGNPHKVIVSSSLHTPNPLCSVCAVQRALLEVQSFQSFTIAHLIQSVIPQLTDSDFVDEIEIYSAQRLLYDPDLEENITKSLHELNISSNTFLTVSVLASDNSPTTTTTLEIGLIHSPTLQESFLIRPHSPKSPFINPQKRIKIN